MKASELKELKREYAGILKKAENEITLPPKVFARVARSAV